MRIAAISTSKVPSATANSIQMLMACQGLAENGQTILALVPGEGETAFETIQCQYGLRFADPEQKIAPFTVQHIRSRSWMRRLDFSHNSVNFARRWNAEAVYAWAIQAAVIASRRGIPVMFEVHDLPTGTFGVRWFRALVRSNTKHLFIFITDALKKNVQAMFPELSEEDCVIAPNGFTPADYENLPDAVEAKERLGYPAKPIVSCSGHLYKGRGVSLFLNLAKEVPDANFFWFGGDPDQVTVFQDEARRKGLTNVWFTGFISKDQLPLAQAASDILLMPYERQIAGSSGGNSAAICSPMKMFEYMAAGRPIVSSDLPVIHEILDDSTAVFCSPENPDEWVAALRKLLDDPLAARMLADAARQKSAEYSWQKRQQKILARFQEG